MAKKKKTTGSNVAAENRKARYNYEILDTLEAGLALTGTEVKSLRAGRASIAESYANAGADALSVLTDEKYFGGHLSYLQRIREAVDLPLLRKDFIIHEAQIFEAVVAGADAILLIVGALEQEELIRLLDTAQNYQLDVLVEVHDIDEMDRALETEAKIIGVNNRNLRTFEVDLGTTAKLSEEVGPDHILVSESGIYTGEDTARIQAWGADAILVGEALMRADDRAAKIAELKGREHANPTTG